MTVHVQSGVKVHTCQIERQKHNVAVNISCSNGVRCEWVLLEMWADVTRSRQLRLSKPSEPWNSSSLASFCTASSTLSTRYAIRPFSPDTHIIIDMYSKYSTAAIWSVTTSAIFLHSTCMWTERQRYVGVNANAWCQCKCSLISDTHRDTEIWWCIAHRFVSPRRSWKPQKPFSLLQDVKWTKEQWER